MVCLVSEMMAAPSLRRAMALLCLAHSLVPTKSNGGLAGAGAGTVANITVYHVVDTTFQKKNGAHHEWPTNMNTADLGGDMYFVSGAMHMASTGLVRGQCLVPRPISDPPASPPPGPGLGAARGARVRAAAELQRVQAGGGSQCRHCRSAPPHTHTPLLTLMSLMVAFQ